jgi:hypothetical protein
VDELVHLCGHLQRQLARRDQHQQLERPARLEPRDEGYKEG